MFTNFIYFIIVLLIYTTYQPSESAALSSLETVVLFSGLVFIFTILTRWQFRKLEYQISSQSFSRLDHQFNTLLTRHSIIAIVLFAVDLYVLNLSTLVSGITLFAVIPTLQAVLFIGLFVLYLAIVWACAHPIYQKLYLNSVSKRDYILSNTSFSLPVLLPWVMLSGIADLINLLPFEFPKQFLATTEGQVIYFLFFLIAVALFAPAMIQKFWGCTPLEPGQMRLRIENLCQKTALEYNDILYWPIFGGKMITAGVMGLIKHFRYILVTNALLRILEPEEIDAVIAHEIGHVKKKHLLFYLVFFIGYMLLSYATFDLIVFVIIYVDPAYRFFSPFGFNQTTVTSILFSLMVILNFIIYFRYIFGYFMRNFERQADAYVYSVSDNARPLISTLEKIAAASGQPPDKPNWHHFSISERIAFLKKCEHDRTWIQRHDYKIKQSITVFLVGMLLVGGIGYNLNYGNVGRKLNNHFFEKIVERELDKDPYNPSLYKMLGDLNYSRKNYKTTIQAYEHALKLQPQNSEVLNNLAWIFATCDDQRYRDSQKALHFALRAAALEPAPHILDTLAESYYVNGKYEKAVSVAREALQSATKNHAYYEDQLKKFIQARQKASGRSL